MEVLIANTDRGLARIQELEAFLTRSEPEAAIVDALNELAWELRTRDPERAQKFSQEAQGRLNTGDLATQPYTRGLTESLITLAFIDTYAGHLDLAARRCFEALALLDPSTDLHAAFKAWYTLGWNHLFLGDYPGALENGLKALKLSQTLEHPLSTAWALDAIASFYGASDDFENAVEMHQQAVQIFQSINEIHGELSALNNLAFTYCRMKHHALALETGLRGLQMAQTHGFFHEANVMCCTISQSLMEDGQLDQAEDYLRQASAGLEARRLNVVHSSVLRELGRLCVTKNDLSGAETHLLQALEVTERYDQRSEGALCHQALSELYEHLGDTGRALRHHKQFHVLHEATLGQRAAQRLAVLNVSHQVASAQHEAEIHRLKTLELQHEIEERKHAQARLERLAALDPLTDLCNRRHFMQVAQHELQRTTRDHQPFNLLLLDLDHFKDINDRHGHVVGDEVLIGFGTFLRSVLRERDTPGRVGGEEFAVILPETPLENASLVAERIRHGLSMTPMQTTAGLMTVTVSVGLVSVAGREDQPMTLETLYRQADSALYAAKQAGRNQVRRFGENSL
jgi:diguanylate cyclase (GGDEF)-like protein